MMRLVIAFPEDDSSSGRIGFYVRQGRGLKQGRDAIIFAYGPVMLNEALIAGELLETRDFP